MQVTFRVRQFATNDQNSSLCVVC